MSLQRTRGIPIVLWAAVSRENKAGEITSVPDWDRPYHTVASQRSERTARAEVPGEGEIEIIKVTVRPDVSGLNSWGRAWFMGTHWDVSAPPEYRHGTRHVRHLTLTLRSRTDSPPEGATDVQVTP